MTKTSKPEPHPRGNQDYQDYGHLLVVKICQHNALVLAAEAVSAAVVEVADKALAGAREESKDEH